MHYKQLVAISATAACVAAQTTRSAADTGPTEVTGCHSRGDEGFFCFDGSDEWVVTSTQYTEENLPDSFDSWPLTSRYTVSVKRLYVCILLTDNNRHCADGNEAATLVFASASSEEEPDDDDDDDQDQAEETNSTVSTGGASTMVTSAVSVATGSSNSTGFNNITSSSTTTSAPPPPPTAVSFCQPRDKTKLFCMAASYEWEVISEWDAKNPPSSFEDCDVHGEEL
jgi:hypothetical protein